MTSPVWKFPPQKPGYPAQEPFQREFFTSENMGGLARALVRESVQNALDAKRKAPVGVRFAVIEIPPEQYIEYFEGLLPHLEEIDGHYVTIPDLSKPMKFLVVEDFNTSGLEGDPKTTFLKDPNPNENFYYFWHNIGRTGKSGTNRGSWGLGKTVFPASSSISTFFGLTTRKTKSHSRLLMGQSVLRYHELNEDEPITPYGYFGIYEDSGPNEYFSLPIENEDYIKRFCSTFNLIRTNSTGLSIVIPSPYFLKENESAEEFLDDLLIYGVQEYFYPILNRDLVLGFESNAKSSNREVIKHENIRNRVSSVKINTSESHSDFNQISFLKLLDFMDWSLSLSETDYILIRPKNNNAPQWTTNYEIDEPLEKARQNFDINQRVAFHVEVGVKSEGKKGRVERGWFRVYLERDESLPRFESYFLRSGIWVKDVQGHKIRGVRGIVIIDGTDNPLVKLLASAENPAHTEWQEQSNTLKSYEGGIYTLRFVRQSLAKLGNDLTKIDREVDQDILKDIFFTEREPETESRHSKPAGNVQTKAEGGTEPTMPEIQSRIPPVNGRLIQNGVEISGSEDSVHIGAVEAEFAYAVRKGNSFQKYDPLDFDLAHMAIETEGVEIESCEHNLLRFIVQDAQFHVRVRGFDSLRDVEMRVSWKDQENEA